MTTERTKAKTFQDLVVWRKAHEFVIAVYRFTEVFPNHRPMGYPRKCGERPFRFRPTSPKGSASVAGRTKRVS